jgi:cyclopropane fatty-acyl-phospholipid synthase-like methyltransferase
MASEEWLKSAFSDGYWSGDILDPVPSSTRVHQEILIGGSYRDAFNRALFPFLRPDARVLELGPGRGSWTRAILEYVTEGVVHAVDFQDVRQWLRPEEYGGRLICHKVDGFLLDCVPDEFFDVCWSFGVLCHHTVEQIGEVLTTTRRKMRTGGVAIHQYAELNKFYSSGRVAAMPELGNADPATSWWPANSCDAMMAISEAAGWRVVEGDMDVFARDGMILLKAW